MILPITTSLAVLFSGVYNPIPTLPMPTTITVSPEVTETTVAAPEPQLTGFKLMKQEEYEAQMAQSATASAGATVAAKPTHPNDGVEARVREYFAKTPIMIRIAYCESRFRQFEKNGDVFRGKQVIEDTGVFQVNTYFNGEEAKKLGHNLKTLEGNMAFAKYLYEKKGTQPWKASKPCWGKDIAVK
jgi:hypothetical protein